MSEVNCRDAGPGRGLCIECATGNYERCLYVAKNKNEALSSFDIIWSVILKEYPYWAVANTMHADSVRLALAPPHSVVSNEQINTARIVRAGATVPEVCIHNIQLGQGCFCPHCPAAAYVPMDWRQQASRWLNDQAIEQEKTNAEFPQHAVAYKSWRDRPGWLRTLASLVLKSTASGPTMPAETTDSQGPAC